MTEEFVLSQIYKGWQIKIFSQEQGQFSYSVNHQGSSFEKNGYFTETKALASAIAYVEAELRFLAGWDAWVQGKSLIEGADPEFMEGWLESSQAGARVARDCSQRVESST